MGKRGDGPKVFLVKAYSCWRNGKLCHIGDYHRAMSPPFACLDAPEQLTFAFMRDDTV